MVGRRQQPRSHRLLIGSLGARLRELRDKSRLNVSKHQIEQVTVEKNAAGVVRGGVNHGLLARLENGETHTLDYETLWRVIEGINAVSQQGAVGENERVALFRANFFERLRYETARFLVYRLYLDAASGPALPLPLAQMHEEMLAHGLGAITYVGKGVKTPNPPERLDNTAGFRLVRIMAETQEAHPYRVALLQSQAPYLIANWAADGAIRLAREEEIAGGARGRKILGLESTRRES